MVWTQRGHKVANLVVAPLDTGSMALNRVHNEFHNGADMCKLGKIVARHQPHFERAQRIRSEDAFEPLLKIADHAGKRRETETAPRRFRASGNAG